MGEGGNGEVSCFARFMKARAVHIDTAVQTSRMVTSRPIQANRRSTQAGAESIAALQVRIQVQRDEKARLARVAQIRSQVDAGIYHIDGRAIVNGLLHSTADWKLLCMETAD